MNWAALSLGISFFANWGTDRLGIFLGNMDGHAHATTWLDYMEKHGFIEKVSKQFEPFDITITVANKAEEAWLMDKLRTRRLEK